MRKIKLAVNGTLMRGFALNRNLVEAGAVFVNETTTAPAYRLWSINDAYPAMQRDETAGGVIQVEVWEVTPAGLFEILQREPPGLCIGRVELANGELVFGVLAEPYICEGQPEITTYGGWKAYVQTR